MSTTTDTGALNEHMTVATQAARAEAYSRLYSGAIAALDVEGLPQGDRATLEQAAIFTRRLMLRAESRVAA